MIESHQNKMVKYLNSLKLKKERDKECVFLAEGLRFVSEIPYDWEVTMYAVSENFLKDNNICCYENKAKVFVFSDSIFKLFSETANSQGIIAVCKQKKYSIEEVIQNNKNGFYILAEELNDPGNLGTMIRTADACGVKGIFLSEGSVDIYNSKVLRATMGSIFHIPILQNVSIYKTIDEMRKKSISVYAAHLEGKKFPYSFDFNKSCAFLVGNEARGLHEKTAELADSYIKIPMPGLAESLNVSMAAGVLMYEVVRQRLK